MFGSLMILSASVGNTKSLQYDFSSTGLHSHFPGLKERLSAGETVLCAEGYLFEFQRRGYLQAGAYVPEVVLEYPDLVRQLHEEFVHAGSDVVEAFTVKSLLQYLAKKYAC